jgi:polysaccharide biosynthesis/export protein
MCNTYLIRFVMGLITLTLAQPNFVSAETAVAAAYVVNPGDVLTIQVWKEPDLQTDVIVRPDSGITFPLVGDMSVRDMSVAQIQSEIAQRIKKYIPDPVVTVAAKRLSGSRIYVIGKVRNPGFFPMDQYVDVMQALSLAGGLTPYASTGSIKILRRDSDKQIVLKFDYSDVEKGKHLDQNMILKSGDVVVVP